MPSDINISLGYGPIARTFREKGVATLAEACAWVNALPYGRNSSKADAQIVLKEERGTCSSKHALIGHLAEEHGWNDCKLILCIFKMSAFNTPLIDDILAKYNIAYIPEAHTYLMIHSKRYDLTFSHNPPPLYLDSILHSEEIRPNQVAAYKVEVHKNFISDWKEENGIEYSLDELWHIREECIRALS